MFINILLIVTGLLVLIWVMVVDVDVKCVRAFMGLKYLSCVSVPYGELRGVISYVIAIVLGTPSSPFKADLTLQYGYT